MSGFLEVCLVTVQVTLGSLQFWRYTIQVQHSKKKNLHVFLDFHCDVLQRNISWLRVATVQEMAINMESYIYIYRGIITVDTHWKNTVARATLCQHTLFPHLLQCEAWAIHADKHELSKNTRQESQSTPVRAIHSIEKFPDLNLCLRRLKTTLTLATCHNNVFDHFHSHHRNQSLLFFHIAINDCFDHGFNTDCLFVQRNQQLCIETYQRGKAVSTHPTGNVSGSSPPKKPEDVRSFCRDCTIRWIPGPSFSPFWTYDMRNSTISRNSSIYEQDLKPPHQSWICSSFARQQQFRSQHLRPLRSQTLHFWQSIAYEKRCEGKRPNKKIFTSNR